MAPVTRQAWKRCPRCSGPMYSGYDDDYSCLFCGEYVFATPPPRVIEPPPLVPPGPRKRGRPRKNPVAA
jgi:tRNA(Ile2) C34 agmatinyltransferase TiaS